VAGGTAQQLEYGGIGAADVQPGGRDRGVAAALCYRGERLTLCPLPGHIVECEIMTQWPRCRHDTAATTFAKHLYGRKGIGRTSDRGAGYHPGRDDQRPRPP